MFACLFLDGSADEESAVPSAPVSLIPPPLSSPSVASFRNRILPFDASAVEPMTARRRSSVGVPVTHKDSPVVTLATVQCSNGRSLSPNIFSSSHSPPLVRTQLVQCHHATAVLPPNPSAYSSSLLFFQHICLLFITPSPSNTFAYSSSLLLLPTHLLVHTNERPSRD
jgi:hypothetical protein